eukprot:498997-Prymnesium_polylepis.2
MPPRMRAAMEKKKAAANGHSHEHGHEHAHEHSHQKAEKEGAPEPGMAALLKKCGLDRFCPGLAAP